MKIDKTQKIEKTCSNDIARPGLSNPFLKDGYLYATDGRVMARIKPLDVEKGMNGHIPSEAFTKARQGAGRSKSLEIELHENKCVVYSEAATLNIPRSDINPPNVDQVIGPALKNEKKIKIGIDPFLLLKLAEALGAVKNGRVYGSSFIELEIADNDKPIVVTRWKVSSEKAMGIICPVRISE